MRRLLPMAALAGLALGACRGNFDESCDLGTEGCACSEAGECFGELMCLSNLCVSPEDAETSGSDDAGETSDAGTSSDASTSAEDTTDDSGEVTDDSGDDDTGVNPEIPTDDAFDGEALARVWTVMNPERANVTLADGLIRLDPVAQTVWWEGSQSVLVHQTGTGDFMVTAAVEATNAGGDAPPSPGLRLGGLMMRDPEASTENYTAVLVGSNNDGVLLETKSTVISTSELSEFAWVDASAEIRICRVGESFRMLARDSNSEPWMPLTTYARPDMPDSVDVGLVAYAAENQADLRVTADFVEFDPAASLDDCTQ